jgi:FixJ family two-component response regulator
VLDVSLPDLNGLELQALVAAEQASTPSIIVANAKCWNASSRVS